MTSPIGPAPSARWLVTAIGAGQLCSWGTLYYSFPLLGEAMIAELGWTKADIYGAATLGLLLAALASYFVGAAIDRGAGRWVLGGGSAIACLLLWRWAHVVSMVEFHVLIAGLGIVQAAVLYEPAFAVVARRVGPARTRAAITSVTLWGGFASTAFIPLVHWLIQGWGWRDTLYVLAGINVALAISYAWSIQPGKDAVHSVPKDRGANRLRNAGVVRATLARPVFWALVLSTTAYALMFSAFTFHMYPMFTEAGLDAVHVVQAIALIGPAQVLGRIAVSLFAARASMRVLGSVVVSVFPIAFALLLGAQGVFWLVVIACVTYGAANGIFTIVRAMVVPEMLSAHAYGALNGLLTVPMLVARAVAPGVAALLWSVNASYEWVLIAILGCAVLTGVGFWTAARLSAVGSASTSASRVIGGGPSRS